MGPHVFIAHSMQDAAWLERLTTMLAPLTGAGLSCWDETQIQPGQHRQAEFMAALDAVRVAVLLASPSFLASDLMLGQQLTRLLEVAHRERRLRILWIPVKPCLWQQSALAAYQAVHDAAKPLSTLSQAEADMALVAICQRIHQAAGASGTLGVSRRNPYRGLSAFQTYETDLFFGRDTLTATLHNRFKLLYEARDSVRLLTILGPSGSGKSSVARAGLLAALVRSPIPGPQPMQIAILKPGAQPIESLARALVPLLPADIAVLPAERAIAIKRLLRSQDAPSEGLRYFAADLPECAQRPVLVLVDQFEEVYTLCSDATERDLFVDLLVHAAQARSGHVSVVLTLRSDFLGETQRHHNLLSRLIAEQGAVVPPLSPEELRDAIAKPAAQAGRSMDHTTVELLLSEERGSQGALPLLEFALTRIWEGMERGEEPGAALRKLGGVGGALAGEAQKIYKSLSEPDQATARRALVRLVRLGEGTRDTRRRVPLSELCGRGETETMVLSVLRQFATEHARLVTLDGEGIELLAEVTHESLFDHWTELRTWLEAGRKDRNLHDRAMDSAKLWLRAGRHDGQLWRPPDLDLLSDYQQRKPDELSPLQEEFLSAGFEQQRKSREAVEKSRQQLLDIFVERGQHFLFQNGKSSEGLLWLHRAWSGGSTNAALPDLLKTAMQSVDASRSALIGHRAPIRRAAFSPDGQCIVTASDDGTARLWKAKDGRLLAELKGHEESVYCATFSPDGHFIVTASWDNTARIWESKSGRHLITLKGVGVLANDHPIPWLSTRRICDVMFSPDGRLIITASDANTARVWEAESGRLLVELKGHHGYVGSAMFSPDGHQIVTASDDRTALIWDAKDGQLLAELKGHGDCLVSAIYSPDGRRILTASRDHTALIWNAEDGQPLAELEGHRSDLVSAMFSPDSRAIVTASNDHTARVWDAGNGRFSTELRGHRQRVNSAVYSPDSRYIVTASDDHTVRVWTAAGGELLAELTGHGASVNSATFSPDGHRIVTASDDHMARVWKAESGRLLAELSATAVDSRPLSLNSYYNEQERAAEEVGLRRRRFSNRPLFGIIHIAFSPDSLRIITVRKDNTVQIWKAEDGQLLAEIKGHGPSVHKATLSPDGRRIVASGWDFAVRVWETEGRRLLAEVSGTGSIAETMMFSPDGHHIVTVGHDNAVRIWEAEGGRLSAEFKRDGAKVVGMRFCPDGLRIVTTSDDHTARVWKVEGARLLAELKEPRANVVSAAFSVDCCRVATTSDDHTARVWEAEGARLLAELNGHRSSINNATFSPDGRRIVTASHDHTARVWEADGGRLLAELKGHGDTVNNAMFSPDGHRIVTVSREHTARVWETEVGRLLAELKGHWAAVNNAMFSPDGRRIVTTSDDDIARVWDSSPETRTDEQLARLIGCHVPCQFEREGSDAIIFTMPEPSACQNDTQQPSQDPASGA